MMFLRTKISPFQHRLLQRQQRNGMKCGICGDPFDVRAPRANEMGGRYYTGIISQRYQTEQVRSTCGRMGSFYVMLIACIQRYTEPSIQEFRWLQVIRATVELTANHNGYFEFHVCRVNGNASLETEECLQRTPLEVRLWITSISALR